MIHDRNEMGAILLRLEWSRLLLLIVGVHVMTETLSESDGWCAEGARDAIEQLEKCGYGSVLVWHQLVRACGLESVPYPLRPQYDAFNRMYSPKDADDPLFTEAHLTDCTQKRAYARYMIGFRREFYLFFGPAVIYNILQVTQSSYSEERQQMYAA